MSDVTDVETAEIDQIMSVQTSDEVKEEPVDPVRAIIAEVEPDDSDKEYKLPFLYARDKGLILVTEGDGIKLCFKELPELKAMDKLRQI